MARSRFSWETDKKVAKDRQKWKQLSEDGPMCPGLVKHAKIVCQQTAGRFFFQNTIVLDPKNR